MADYLHQIMKLIGAENEIVEALMVVNQQGVIEFYHAGQRFSQLWSDFSHEVEGRPLVDVYDELNENNSTVLKALHTGMVTVGEQQVLTHDNIRLTMTTTTYPLLDEQHNIQGAVDIARFLEVNVMDNASREDQAPSPLNNIVTRSPEMVRLKEVIHSVAQNDSAVLLYGETGTGKGLFAESIHQLSPRRDAPFLTQNCAAIPENLLESIFFGTERGGFTGAESKKGLFELADGGTLFLDEINSMAPSMQAKLLKAIEDQKVRHIGGKVDIPFNVRIICASNEDPEVLMASGRMRTDLYYRVGVICLRIPPLRERTQDVLPLAEHYIALYNQQMNKNILGLSQMAKDLFADYLWPGNVRELRNTIERAFNLEQSRYITLGSIRDVLRMLKPKEDAVADAADSAPAEPKADALMAQLERDGIDLSAVLDEYEAELIRQTLKRFPKLNEAARRLSLSPQTLRYRMKHLSIQNL